MNQGWGPQRRSNGEWTAWAIMALPCLVGQIGLPAQERKGAFDVLRACAFTYLAAALTSILQLLWLLGQRQE